MRNDWEDKLERAVDRKMDPIYEKDYGRIKETYIQKYGQRNWIGKMAEAMAGRQPAVKAKEDKPYLAARRSIERFEKGQFQSMKKYGPGIEKAGRQLPPIGKKLAGDTITVTVKGEQPRSGGRPPRIREWTVTFKGDQAHRFAQDPTMGEVWDATGYPEDVIETFESENESGGLYNLSVA